MKFNVSPNIVCAIETAVITVLYMALLFAGAKFLISLI